MFLLIKRKIFFYILFFVISISVAFSQKQTVGLFLNSPETSKGYILLAASPHDEATYLIDNCGRIVHSWPITPQTSGLSAYLMDNGNLLRVTTMKDLNVVNNFGWGRLEILDWEGNLVWEYTYSDGKDKQMHHDVEIMPNGNLLFLAYEFKNTEELIEKARVISSKIKNLWVDHIVEIKPIGKQNVEIVWQWHAWDHLIQDNDRLKDNFGNINSNPNRINLNYTWNENEYETTWLHANSISYNPEKDLIIVSIKNFSEFWIIDHSTSTKEAATNIGGKYGKGGDLLFRWGNDNTFGGNNSRKLFDQHDVHWISSGKPGAGNILIFNNGSNGNKGIYSSVFELKLDYSDFQIKGANTIWSYNEENSINKNFYSVNLSSANRMENGNTFITQGINGNLFEVNPEGKKVWKYISPIQYGKPLKQGDSVYANSIFKTYKYPINFSGFKNKSLIPKGFIEGKNPFVKCKDIKIEKKKSELPVTIPNDKSEINIFNFMGIPVSNKNSLTSKTILNNGFYVYSCINKETQIIEHQKILINND